MPQEQESPSSENLPWKVPGIVAGPDYYREMGICAHYKRDEYGFRYLASWDPRFVREYHVTGVLVSGRRFRTMVYQNYQQANSINLWRGSVWAVDHVGKRHLIKRVWN